MGGTTKDGKITQRGQEDIDRMIARWEREPRHVSLPQSTVDMTGERHEGDGTRVRALIPMETRYVEHISVDGEVLAWTPRAVLVRAVLKAGHAPSDVWVWASAVKRIEPGQNGSPPNG